MVDQPGVTTIIFIKGDQMSIFSIIIIALILILVIAYTKSPAEKASKIKYVTKTYYGKGNDLMDHAYYQGGAQGTSRKR